MLFARNEALRRSDNIKSYAVDHFINKSNKNSDIYRAVFKKFIYYIGNKCTSNIDGATAK